MLGPCSSANIFNLRKERKHFGVALQVLLLDPLGSNTFQGSCSRAKLLLINMHACAPQAAKIVLVAVLRRVALDVCVGLHLLHDLFECHEIRDVPTCPSHKQGIAEQTQSDLLRVAEVIRALGSRRQEGQGRAVRLQHPARDHSGLLVRRGLTPEVIDERRQR